MMWHKNKPGAGIRHEKVLRAAKWLTMIVVGLLLALVLFLAAARTVFDITSSNAVIYLVRHPSGVTEFTNHLRSNENDNVVRMLDFSCLFNLFAQTKASIGLGHLELTWSDKDADGVIKDFRSDGTEFLVVLSRYAEDEGTPQGVFIGGDLPLGDTQRTMEAANNNTGMAYYDGKRWNHIWCSLNEGVSIRGMRAKAFTTVQWKYLGSTVLKRTTSEVIVESRHELTTDIHGSAPVTIAMKRTVQKKAGEDYVILKVEFSNPGTTPFAYAYELGDEPWVGDFFRGSRGNIGWTDGELYKYESFIRPSQHSFAGFWDIGNDVIHEKGEFTGYADFMEWLSTPPSFVYVANNFGFDRVNEKKPLDSWNNRVIGLIWLNQELGPGERREHVVAIGMAKPGYQAGSYFPVKPDVSR